jgi:hypothetical protein
MTVRQKLYFYGLLAYLAILPVANTVALRSLLIVLLLGILLSALMCKTWRDMLAWPALKSPVFIPLLLWGIYLCAFPLLAEQPDTARENLRGQWGMSIAAWIIGIGGVLLLGRRGPSLWQLGMASALLVMLHLLMSLLAWSGLLGAKVPSDMPLTQMLAAVRSVITENGAASWSWQPFPWGFRGFDPMHGNLGYTADQAIILFICCLVFVGLSRRSPMVWAFVGCVLVCFMSMVIAYSRGAVLYGLLMIVIAGLVFSIRIRESLGGFSIAWRGMFHWSRHQLVMLFASAIVLTGLLGATFFFVKKDVRWHQMIGKVDLALTIEDPITLLCHGLDENFSKKLQAHLRDRDPEQVLSWIQGLNSDGGRILLMRVGVVLAAEHPLGLDGSRFSYQKLITAKCERPPAMAFAHAHQGWLDTAFALGWMGSLLLFVLLASLTFCGWRYMRYPAEGPWALALFLLSIFWILRGFADSVYREHLLQMQAVLLGYLCARMVLENVSAAKRRASCAGLA